MGRLCLYCPTTQGFWAGLRMLTPEMIILPCVSEHWRRASSPSGSASQAMTSEPVTHGGSGDVQRLHRKLIVLSVDPLHEFPLWLPSGYSKYWKSLRPRASMRSANCRLCSTRTTWSRAPWCNSISGISSAKKYGDLITNSTVCEWSFRQPWCDGHLQGVLSRWVSNEPASALIFTAAV